MLYSLVILYSFTKGTQTETIKEKIRGKITTVCTWGKKKVAAFFPGVVIMVADKENESGIVFLIIPGYEPMGKTIRGVFSHK